MKIFIKVAKSQNAKAYFSLCTLNLQLTSKSFRVISKMNKSKIIAEPGKQELFITREFDAPIELVFEAHTPKQRSSLKGLVPETTK